MYMKRPAEPEDIEHLLQATLGRGMNDLLLVDFHLDDVHILSDAERMRVREYFRIKHCRTLSKTVLDASDTITILRAVLNHHGYSLKSYELGGYNNDRDRRYRIYREKIIVPDMIVRIVD
jgi:hypothetical protein